MYSTSAKRLNIHQQKHMNKFHSLQKV